MEPHRNHLDYDNRKDSRRDDLSPCFIWLRGRDLHPHVHEAHCALDAILCQEEAKRRKRDVPKFLISLLFLPYPNCSCQRSSG